MASGVLPEDIRRVPEAAGEALPRGNLVPDAHLVAPMRGDGVRTRWTHDRDHRGFPGIGVRDPSA